MLYVSKEGVQFGDVGMVRKGVDLQFPHDVLLGIQLPQFLFHHHLHRAHEPRTPLHRLEHLTVRSLPDLLQKQEIIRSKMCSLFQRCLSPVTHSSWWTLDLKGGWFFGTGKHQLKLISSRKNGLIIILFIMNNFRINFPLRLFYLKSQTHILRKC